MISLRVRLRNDKRLAKKFGRLAVLSETEARKAVLNAAIRTQATAKQMLNEPGRGRIYTRGGVQHVASAPGDPPAPDRGTLRSSVQFQITEQGKNAIVWSNLAKALFLEFGTRKMAARPWLRPTIQIERPRFLEDISNRYKRLMRRS